MKRKILSFLLVAAMLVSMVIFAPTAGATESLATLEFGTATGASLETVTVDLKVTTAQLSGLQFMFEYDASRLDFDGITWTDEFGTGFPVDMTENDAFVQFTHNGPYRVLGWATGIGVGAVDLSAGVVLATLTFTIKEDAPLGDAEIGFAYLLDDTNAAVQPNKIEPNMIIGESMTFVDGKVTVLPAGYSSASAEADFVFADGVITGYTGSETGTIVVPSTIGGEAVTSIASGAFNGIEAAAIIFPESVTSIAFAAVLNADSLTDAYILNSEATIGANAIGWHGVLNKKKTGWATTEEPYVNNPADNEDIALTTIHGYAGSTAETHTDADVDGYGIKPSWSTDLPNSISFVGNSYFVGATAKAPGTMEIGGKKVVAWTDGVNSYVPGAEITMNGALSLEPVTIAAPVTNTVVDFKFAEKEADLAMRFTANMAKADYATLAELGTVQLGMMITPAKRVAQAGSFTKEALDALTVTHKYVDIAIDGYYQVTDTDYIFAGSLKGFSASTLASNPDFAAIVYATVTTAEGDVFTVYGDFNFDANQNVKGVAESFADSDQLYDTQKGWLNNLLTKFGV